MSSLSSYGCLKHAGISTSRGKFRRRQPQPHQPGLNIVDGSTVLPLVSNRSTILPLVTNRATILSLVTNRSRYRLNGSCSSVRSILAQHPVKGSLNLNLARIEVMIWVEQQSRLNHCLGPSLLR